MMSLLLGTVASSAILAAIGPMLIDVSRLACFTVVKHSPEMQITRHAQLTVVRRSPEMQVSRIVEFVAVKRVLVHLSRMALFVIVKPQ